MLVTLSGMVTLVRLVLKKAEYPMLVTPFGMVMLVSPRQKLKASRPMLVTLLPMVTLVSLVLAEL
jgi:hypothetical protein